MILRPLLAKLGFAYEKDDHGRWRRGTWSQTYSGQKVFLMDMRADEVRYDDVCVGGARECRFGNQCREEYSVNEHEILVSIYAEKFARKYNWSDELVLEVAREGLCHDSGESYIGDCIRPVKHDPAMRSFRRAEHRIQNAVFEHFGVKPTRRTTALIKEIDNRVLVDEINALMLDPQMYLDRHDERHGLGAEIAAMSSKHAAIAWSQRFAELWPGYTEYIDADGACHFGKAL